MIIQIVEDDRALSDGIEITLSDDKTEFKKEHTIKNAVTGFQSYGSSISLIILDINLPDGTGYDYLKTVRAQSNVPVLILTANDMEMDEVKGLTLGADDFLTKPFSLAVLRARVNALLRRSSISTSSVQSEKTNSVYKLDDMVFDFGRLVFKKQDNELFLSVNEQRLLKLFLDNKGSVLTRDMLMERLWGEDGTFVDENTLSVTINRLRSKIDGDEKAKKSKHINTVYGQGYRFD